MFIGRLFEGRCIRPQPRCMVRKPILALPLVTSVGCIVASIFPASGIQSCSASYTLDHAEIRDQRASSGKHETWRVLIRAEARSLVASAA